LTVVLTVTVPPPDDASNVTVSPEPGNGLSARAARTGSPVRVSEASHAPVPPTQNLLTTFGLH
jgi:hypothetical protein